MITETKQARLLALAKRRQATRWPGYTSIGDYHNGAYECDLVSPYTKTASNLDADVMILLQDWASSDALSGPLDENARTLGYTPSEPTSRNLERLLRATFDLALTDTYGTNLFPFVKPGGMSARIPEQDLTQAAREFAIPQIEIICPRLVVCLGLVTFNAVRSARAISKASDVEAAIAAPFSVGGSEVWCQAHTGHFGQMTRNKGGMSRVSQDWAKMRERFVQLSRLGHFESAGGIMPKPA